LLLLLPIVVPVPSSTSADAAVASAPVLDSASSPGTVTAIWFSFTTPPKDELFLNRMPEGFPAVSGTPCGAGVGIVKAGCGVVWAMLLM
jgi:hypothetical protein